MGRCQRVRPKIHDNLMVAISADPARELTLYFRINKDGNLLFYFLDSNGASFDLSLYSIVVNFKTRKNDSTNILQLIPVVTGNSLTLTLTKAQSALFREQTYYWEMVRTKSLLEKVWLTGDAIFHLGKFDGTDNQSETLTISESEEIFITVYDTSFQS